MSISTNKIEIFNKIRLGAVEVEQIKRIQQMLSDKPNTIISYIDGSKGDNIGSGVVIIKRDSFILQAVDNSIYPEEYKKFSNVCGEIYASMIAIKNALTQKSKFIIINYDYMGVESWATGEWKANNDLTKSYAKIMKDLRQTMNIQFVKVKSHSGDTLNNLADRLAKLSESGIVFTGIYRIKDDEIIEIE